MKRNMMTRFSAGCLTLLLIFGSVCRVQAAQEPAEPNAGQSAEQMVQTGSVTVQLTPGKEGTSVADVEFFLTKVGEIQDSTYTLLPEYDKHKDRFEYADHGRAVGGGCQNAGRDSQTRTGEKNGWKRTSRV